MERRAVGSLDVSVVGLGCNNFGMRIDQDAVTAVVNAALDAGVTLFDTADIYGGTRSEQMLGVALGSRREHAVIATKFGMAIRGEGGGGSPDYVKAACEASLKRLGTDRIDLYQIHIPDAATPIEETLGAFDDLVRDGKVLEIGCSNFDGTLLDAAAAAADARGTARFVSVQNELNLLDRRGEADLLAAAERHDLGVLPYFPLANGMLTGKYKRGEGAPEGSRLGAMPEDAQARAFADKTFDVVERLTAFAADSGHTLLELAMSWLAGLPHMASVIAGATRPEQVAANAAAVSWALTAADRTTIDELTRR